MGWDTRHGVEMKMGDGYRAELSATYAIPRNVESASGLPDMSKLKLKRFYMDDIKH